MNKRLLTKHWLIRSAAVGVLLNPLALALADDPHSSLNGSNGGIGVEILNPRIPQVPSVARVASLYLELVNHRQQSRRLISARSPVANTVEFHISELKNGMYSMRRLPELSVEGGQTLRLQPGDIHIMLIGLKRTLKVGEQIPFSLSFEGMSDVELMATVVSRSDSGNSASAKAHVQDHSEGHGHQH